MKFYRPLLFLGLFIYPLVSIHSQSRELDSLRSLLETMPEDTNKILLINKLVYELSYGEKDEAFKRVKESMLLSKKLNYERGLYGAYDLLGIIYMDKGDLDSAQTCYMEALNYYQVQNDEEKLFSSYQKLSQVHMQRNSFEIAEEYVRQEIDIATRSQDARQMGNSYNDLASLHINKGWYSYDNENDTVNYINHFHEAVPHIHTAIAYFQKADYPKGVALAYGNLAILQMQLDELDSSLQSMRKATSVFEANGFKIYTVNTYNQLSVIYQKMKKYDSALLYAQKTLELSETLESKFDTRNAYGQFSQTYELLGEYRLALKYNQLYNDVNSQLLAESKQTLIDELEVKYQLDFQNNQLQIREVQNQKQEIIILYGSILLITLLFVVLFLWRRAKIEKGLNVTLAEKSEALKGSNGLILKQNARIMESYHEQKNLMAVVAHDLRAPLNNVRSIIDLLPDSGDLNEDQQDLIEMTKQVTDGGISLINDMISLSRYEDDTQISKSRIDLNQLLKENIDTHNSHAHDKQISIEFSSDCTLPHTYIDSDKVKIIRVMDNLISNAIKFSPYGSAVRVSLTSRGEDMVRISVIDHGPGMSEEDLSQVFGRFKRLSAQPTGGESSTGLGLSIVKTLVDKLGGNVSIESTLHKGTCFHLDLQAQVEHEEDPKAH